MKTLLLAILVLSLNVSFASASELTCFSLDTFVNRVQKEAGPVATIEFVAASGQKVTITGDLNHTPVIRVFVYDETSRNGVEFFGPAEMNFTLKDKAYHPDNINCSFKP